MMQSLTLQIYDFIVSYKIAHNGNSPSIRDIGAAVYINSTSQVRYRLDLLVDAGLIRYLPDIARSIEIVGGRWIRPENKG